MYASKRRQRNFKRVREPPKHTTATNPSKRHRERLNGELETVAVLLPYDHNTISRLDKLSVLRLAVSYLQCKSHFEACLQNSSFLNNYPLTAHNYFYQPQPRTMYSNKVPTVYDVTTGTSLLDSEEADFETISLKALGGFLLIINENGDIYYASENIEDYLGFHQSDVLHQPLYDLIHSEDRDDICQRLDMNFNMPMSGGSQDLFSQDSKVLERNVNARFRCLLDNTCGFLRMDIRGKLMSLHGLPSSYVMGRGQPGPVLGMIAVCTPFVPPSTAELGCEDLILKSKHHLDGSFLSMDKTLYDMLEIDENEMPLKLYDTIHVEDALCMAEAHKEVIKNGSSGLLVYRMISTKSRRTYFLQSSCRMFYKNGKSDSIGLTHRLLNEVEGTMLLEKRSTLKAKLLSFDDSFLQSPRNLQSTANLPLPGASQKDEPIASTSDYRPTPLPAVKSRRTKTETPTEVPLPTSLIVQPKNVLDHWAAVQAPFEVTPFVDHQYPPITTHWPQEFYTSYHQGPYPNLTHIPTFPEHAELAGWNGLDHGGHHPVDKPMTMKSNQLDVFPKYHPHEVLADEFHVYGLPQNSQTNGFNLISEVTNLLGTQ